MSCPRRADKFCEEKNGRTGLGLRCCYWELTSLTVGLALKSAVEYVLALGQCSGGRRACLGRFDSSFEIARPML